MFDILDVEQEVFRCKTEVQQPLAAYVGIDEVVSYAGEEEMQDRSAATLDFHELKMALQQRHDS